MSYLEEMTTKVVDNMPAGDRQKSIAGFILIMELIMELLPRLMEVCNQDPEEIIAHSKRNRWAQKRIIRRQTRRVLGRKGYREQGQEVADAVTKTCATSTPEEIQRLYDDIKRQKEDL